MDEGKYFKTFVLWNITPSKYDIIFQEIEFFIITTARASFFFTGPLAPGLCFSVL
jgi:hypothetical protein